ncbi:DUF1611 domain-containing protein [Synechococcus sp. UW179A]|nr:DUF1611 domain-containing protein [Synechococcus sp. UW179A]
MSRLDDQQASAAVKQFAAHLGILCRDPIRHGAGDLLQALITS